MTLARHIVWLYRTNTKKSQDEAKNTENRKFSKRYKERIARKNSENQVIQHPKLETRLQKLKVLMTNNLRD